MSRIAFEDKPAKEQWPDELFVVLSETLVMVQRNDTSVNVCKPERFTKFVSDSMSVTERRQRYLVATTRPPNYKTLSVVDSAQHQSYEQQTAAAYGRGFNRTHETIGEGVEKTFGRYTVFVSANAEVRSLLSNGDTSSSDRNWIQSVNSTRNQYFAVCATEAEFDEKFGKAMTFLASKDLYQTLVGKLDIFVEHAHSLYVFDSQGLLHITPENTATNAARFSVKGYEYAVYFK